MQGVTGSIPVVSTIQKALKTLGFQRFFTFRVFLVKPKGQQKGQQLFGIREEETWQVFKKIEKTARLFRSNFAFFSVAT